MSKENTLNKYRNIEQLKDNEIKLSKIDDIIEIMKNLMIITLNECVKFGEIAYIYVYILAPKINDDKLTINVNGYSCYDKLCFNEIVFIRLNNYMKNYDRYKELLSIYEDLTFIKDMAELKIDAKENFDLKIINDIVLLNSDKTEKTEYYIDLAY